MFVDRVQELEFLNQILQRERPGPAQLILLYGRRRVGKTVLLRHWAEQSGVSFTYWSAEKELAQLQRRKFFARLLGVPLEQSATFESWADLWQATATIVAGKRHILIIDELPYAAEADPAMLSALQHAWDHQLKQSEAILVVCGSHIHTMETLLSQQSPLFGRMTGQWHLHPLPFSSLREFLPSYSEEELVATYALVGGVPAYLEWLDPQRSFLENLRSVILAPGSMFQAEPAFLLYDEVREPRVHLAILQAIGNGQHTIDAIANTSFVGKNHLSAYLARLQELRLVERRLPATLRAAERRISRQGRYHLADAYFRFYFRFLAPHQDELSYHPERVIPLIQQGLRGFVGSTAFEELARQWVTHQGAAGVLPFIPEMVGSSWSRQVQVDVLGINWQRREVLIGECKWGAEPVSRQVVRELIEVKAPLILATLPDAGEGWQVHFALFTRAGLTEAAHLALTECSGMAIDLPALLRGVP